MKLFFPIVILAAFGSAGQVVAFLACKSNDAFARQQHATGLKAATVDPEGYEIDEERRFAMNMIVLGAGLVTVAGFGVPYLAVFVPPSPTNSGGAVLAKDVFGSDIVATNYLASKPAGDRSLVEGLKGDAAYLIVKDDHTLEKYGLNAICTHLGCVVPWSESANKFICPCHGSQYSPDGEVVRGPAPLPLALEHCDVDENGKVILAPWVEDDFRTGEKAWWN